ncbi:AAA family ATPase [Shewanella schlegeliana]|uniref:ATP-binding protein n=1 Tax=Shewanella schlegeliana TaxID=190308 RepID=A0ABS1T007_9GAMM|nr:ATP-binding protein [Shewanella schlegeliana]MBL4914107.1 ATP-binding protein [Shewanella schlegeliana]MCL1110856.1 AAA family ATPase [Shewanella schlegeliana]GIU38644.1 ATPase [Shewanella schlegeliana]
MASANQIKQLVRHFIKKDEKRFLSVVLQIAAHEAKIGHTKVAEELRNLVDNAKLTFSSPASLVPEVLSSNSSRIDLARANELFSVSHPTLTFKNMILSSDIEGKLIRFLDENRNSTKIRQYGLVPRRHLLLYGPPGTGKTMSASVIAHELHLPLFTVRMDSLMTKFMGETSAKLRSIFEYINSHKGVYLFDEFDSIGTKRSVTNDVGEIRRVLNTFLQLLDEHESDSLIISATNHKEILDHALYRRFDDVIEYDRPTELSIIELIESRFISFKLNVVNTEVIVEAAQGLSYAEIRKSCDDAIKYSLINNVKTVEQELLVSLLMERRSYQN